jgi:hypothetical protein
MNNNPDESTKSELSKHRSFRLTPSSSFLRVSEESGSPRSAIVFSIIQQLPLLVLSSLILDGGQLFKHVAIASVAVWILIVIALVRRGRQPSGLDWLAVKWGFVPFLLITIMLSMIFNRILY